MLCLKKRRTYSFTQGVCGDLPRRTKKDHRPLRDYGESLDMAITTLPRKNRSREERPSRMVLTVTEDTPADMLAGSMELLVQLPRDNHIETQRVTVQRSTPMMDLLVQIATAHKLAASSYTLQAIGERGLVLPHQPNTPIGALDALQVKLLPKQGTFAPRKTKQANQPFETTFRLQVHLPRNQLYVSRVSPKMNLGEILDEVCREKNLDRNKYELRHPVNLEEVLDLSLSLQDYHLQEVTLYAKQGRSLGSVLCTQDIMALQRQEERRRQQAKQGVFGFMFKKSKEGSLSTDSLGGRSASPARSDETGRSSSPLQPPARPQRKRRPAPKPPSQIQTNEETVNENSKDKIVISHSRNSSDSSGYHEASVLSDNPDSAGRLPETLPRRNRVPAMMDAPRKLAQTSQSSKSLGNLATASGMLSHGISCASLSSTGLRKKRAAPPPPVTRPLSSAISTQGLERIVDSEESLTSDMDPSKPPSDIGAPSKANSDIDDHPKASSDIGITTKPIDFTSPSKVLSAEDDAGSMKKKMADETCHRSDAIDVELDNAKLEHAVEVIPVEAARVSKRVGEPIPLPKSNTASTSSSILAPPVAPKRRPVPLSNKTLNANQVDCSSNPGNPTDELSYKKDKTDVVSLNSSEIYDVKQPRMKPIHSDAEIHYADSYESKLNKETNDAVFVENVNDKEIIHRPRPLPRQRNRPASTSSLVIEEIKEKSLEAPVKENIANIGNHKEIQRKNVDFESGEYNSIMKSIPISDKTCAVISTLPKCDHLVTTENNDLLISPVSTKTNKPDGCNTIKNYGKNSFDDSTEFIMINEGVKDNVASENPGNKNEEQPRYIKRSKVYRSVSKANDFETNTLEKQKRHLTSHSEDITFALNMNFSNVDLSSDFAKDLDKNIEIARKDNSILEQDTNLGRDSFSGLDGGKVENGLESISDLSETDILLQKVSDTLSNSLSVSKEAPLESHIFNDSVVAKESANIVKKQETSDCQDTISNRDTSNLTLNSQQDTSDYISAIDEDLSITDWEYQLPAPPTAFRDTNSPKIEGYDTITLDSVDAFREPILLNEDQPDNSKNINIIIENNDINREETKAVPRKEEKLLLQKEEISEAIKEEPPKMKINKEPQKINSQVELKKEIINELENKISSLPQMMKENDNRKVVDIVSTPKIAPVDNTLSNFTITTYTRQKSLNIFEEQQEKSENSNSDERFMKSFPTLSREKSNFKDSRVVNKNSIDGVENGLAINDLRGDNKELKKLEPKMSEEPLHRWTANDLRSEKINIQRSKSYLSVSDNKKYNGEISAKNYDSGIEKNLYSDNELKKSTSITNLNGPVPRSNEKFSQWRENILKRQEEPTKEKQLQSLQVLKSILPQLKNTQQAEENVSKENRNLVLNETGRSETASNENTNEPNISLSRDSRTQIEPKKFETESKKLTEEKKRYTYSGPPAISLGSWSERPSINVQIKMDTDYKFGLGKPGSGKTIVNIKGTKDEPDSSNYAASDKNAEDSGSIHLSATKKEDFTKKSTNHTAASVFKIPTLSNVNTMDVKSTINCTEKPTVTGVELKKTFAEKEETKMDESIIDTSPMNFKELTKAFGQDVCIRTKPKRLNPNRRSEHFNTQPDNIPRSIETSVKLNGHVNSASNNLTNGTQHETRPKRFTSVVGINPQNQSSGQNFAFRNSINTLRNNQPMPVVKGFKIQGAADAKVNVSQDSKPVEGFKSGPQPPKPPTMPVITGVTLKSASARPKSMPVQTDPRDTLLESIRNFGGHGNLKKATERC